MGTDIHVVIEYRPRIGWTRNDGTVRALQRLVDADPVDRVAFEQLRALELHADTWEVAYFVPNDWPEGDGEDEEREEAFAMLRQLRTEHPDRFSRDQFGDMQYSVVPDPVFTAHRDYLLFPTLTGTVRNFDGDLRTITTAPRGLPPDLSRLARLEHASDGPDAHSETFFTAQELLDWPGWSEPERREGFVSLREAAEWLRRGMAGGPTPWPAQRRPGPTVRLHDEELSGGASALRAGLVRLLKETRDPQSRRRTFVRFSWLTTRREDTDPRFHAMVEFWARHSRPDTVGFVMWFDN